MVMSTELLQPPAFLSHNEILRVSQRAPQFLRSQTKSALSLPYPLSLLTASESQEKWQAYENLLLSCLSTGDDESANLCIEELTKRFGETNERVQALRGLYEEATAEDDKARANLLVKYEEVIKETPTNMVR